VLGLLGNSVPFICFTFSLQTIPSSLSALINGITPISTMFFASVLLKDERLNFNRILGIILGSMGFLILFLPAVLSIHTEFNHEGILYSLFGALSYALANVYARKYLKEAPPYVAPTLQLSTSLIYLIPLSLWLESPLETLQHAPLSAWGAALALSVFGTALAFIMYHRIVRNQGATAVGTVAYLLPIIGTIMGVVFLKESIGIHFAIAALLIIGGVMAVNGAFRKRGQV
jgi:drug/metabolite transporter (DMT)-like permease